MKPGRVSIHLAAILLVLAAALAAPMRARAAGTITVNTTEGAGADDSLCSLREAIEAAGAISGSSATGDCAGGTAGTDTITFSIPTSDTGYDSGTGIYTVSIATVLIVSSPVIIDGTTQPGYTSSPVVRVNGSGSTGVGLWVQGGSAGSTIKGLMLTNFVNSTVSISDSDATVLSGNYIGTNGSMDYGSSTGVSVNSSDNVVIGGTTSAERNVIAGNSGEIEVEQSTGVSVKGNYIGVFADGSTSPSGGSYGVVFATLPQANTAVTSSYIGGPGAGEGNVIAGHSVAEIWIVSDDQSFSDNNTVQGNIIGLTASGTGAPSVTSGDGVKVVNSDNTLVEGNTISAKSANGVDVQYDASWVKGGGTPVAPDGTIIRSNKIGTSPDGMTDLGNGTGVYLKGATNTIVGGNGDLTKRNLISGNGYGVKIEGGSGNIVDTNWIGLNPLGLSLLNSSYGIYANVPITASRNWVAKSPTGIYLTASGTFSAASNNCLTGNTMGLDNTTGSAATFQSSWWGAADGPSGAGSGSGDPVSIDVDFSSFLTTPPAACSVLANASFETDANVDKKPDNWTFTNFKTKTDYRDCTVMFSDACSLRLKGNGTQKTASQTIMRSGIAGDTFTFSLWSRAYKIPSTSVYRVQLRLYNGTTLVSKTNLNFTKGTHDFQQISTTYTAPGAYTKVMYKIIFKAGAGNAWFDDAVLSWAP